MAKCAVLGGLVLAVAASGAAESFERTLPLAPGKTLRVEAEGADVTVTPGPSGQVAFQVETDGTIGKDLLVEAREGVDGPVLEVRRPRRGLFNVGRGPSARVQIHAAGDHGLHLEVGGGSARVDVTVARDAEVEIGGGTLRMVDVNGRLKAEIAGGDATIGAVGGDAAVEVAGGDVRLAGVGGSLSAEAAGGDVRAGSVGGSATVESAGGDVRVGPVVGRFEVESHGGDATVEIGSGNSAGGEVSSAGGDVRLLLDSAAAVDLDLGAAGGSVEARLPIDVQGKMSGSSLIGKRHGGGTAVRARAAGGDVVVEARGAESE